MTLNNPFVINRYAGDEYFCDRVEETKMLVTLLTNEHDVALISHRRIGKTNLLYHCFDQPVIKENYFTFIIDIYATTSVRDFVNVFGRAILETLRSRGRKIWETFLTYLSSLRSEISFDINGNPVWGMGLGAIENPAVTLDEIFHYLNDAGRPCLIAIDEFQQITKYSDKNIEATLRTYIQRCPNAHFIFSGSHRHLMGEIFTSAARPFYQSVTLFNLPLIDEAKYAVFAKRLFADRGKQLDDAVVAALYQRFEGITSYLQRTMNILFANTPVGGTCTPDMIDNAVETLLSMSNEVYEALFYQLPEKQREVVTAIAQEGKAQNIMSGQFIHRHRLSTPSSVKSAADGLLEKDLVTRDKDIYRVYDLLFALWILRKMNT